MAVLEAEYHPMAPLLPGDRTSPKLCTESWIEKVPMLFIQVVIQGKFDEGVQQLGSVVSGCMSFLDVGSG